MSKIDFGFDIVQVKNFLQRMMQRTPEQILQGGAPVAQALEDEAKLTAPWTDRTGMARATLEGINAMSDLGPYYCIGICGNMPYSVDLENNYKRKYAVLRPVLMRHKNDLLNMVRSVISRQEGIG